MNIRKILISFSLVALLAMVGFVSAQDATSTPAPESSSIHPTAIIGDIVAQETGLDKADIRAQMRQGSTLADIITSNGGNVQSVIDQSVAQLTASIQSAVINGELTQERADNLLANLTDVVTRVVNGDLFPNRLDAGAVRRQAQSILLQSVVDETGLTIPQILEQRTVGKTLAEVITANNSTVDTVVSSAVATATEQINAAVADGRLGQEQAGRLIVSLTTRFTTAVNSEYREHAAELLAGAAVVHLAAEQTGMTVTEIMQAIRSGSTLGQILTENGVDTNTFIDTAVAQAEDRLDKAVINGRLTQEQADQRLFKFRDKLTARLNQVSDNPETTPFA